MTFTFFSNFLNHHQLPLCLAWQDALGDAFTFVAMQPFDSGAVAGSYQDMNKAYSFCLAAYENEETLAHAQKLANESDVVLYGATLPTMFRARVACGKLTFRYSERIFKPYYTKNKAYTYVCAMGECLWYARSKNTWLLAAGAYAAHDYASVGGFGGRALRWGYFPAVEETPSRVFAGDEADVQESAAYDPQGADALHLLWAGRMIAYKHGERVLPLLQALCAENIAFVLTVAGDGPLRSKLETLFAPFGSAVQFVGTLPIAQTRILMQESDVFLFTSDESEGWGAVLSEAMADGCAVLASDACGASKFLIRDTENGMLFADGDEQDFVKKGLALARWRPKREQMGKKAAQTMRETWNAKVAAARLLEVSNALLAGHSLPEWQDGPCSKDTGLAHRHRREP